MHLASQIPVIYEKLLPVRFLALDGSEKKANCSNCYMRRSEEKKPFLESTKCCTYYPFIPNYLVGGMLYENLEASKSMRNLIRDRQWILPLGVIAPPSYQLKHQNKHIDEFGRNSDLVCPFYISQKGQCSVWKWRDSQCSTYFCTYDNPSGPERWSKIQQFLFDTEMLISQECMLQKGFNLAEISQCLKWVRYSELNDPVKPYNISALDWNSFWRHQQDSIEAYFIDCYKQVLAKSEDFKRDIEHIFSKYESDLK